MYQDDLRTNYSENQEVISDNFSQKEFMNDDPDLFDALISESIQETETPFKNEPEISETIKVIEDSFEQFGLYSKKNVKHKTHGPRTGKFDQSKIQRIIKLIFDAHPCKNLPSEIYRKIKNFLIPLQRLQQLDQSKKRMDIGQFEQFIKNSGLTEEDWEEIFNLEIIERQIDRSKKIGNSKHIKNFSDLEKSFLIDMNKNALKIIYKSVKRNVRRALENKKIESYMDNQCHADLQQLDLAYENHPVFAKTYQSFVVLLN